MKVRSCLVMGPLYHHWMSGLKMSSLHPSPNVSLGRQRRKVMSSP